MICAGAKAPVATCCAMRRVIVVVLPEPAPARMQTGPRTASAARRCSGFRPSSGSTEAPYRRLRRPPVTEPELLAPRGASTPSVQGVFEYRFGTDALRFRDHRAQLGHELGIRALVGEPLELGDRLFEPAVVDHRARSLHDLRV